MVSRHGYVDLPLELQTGLVINAAFGPLAGPACPSVVVVEGSAHLGRIAQVLSFDSGRRGALSAIFGWCHEILPKSQRPEHRCFRYVLSCLIFAGAGGLMGRTTAMSPSRSVPVYRAPILVVMSIRDLRQESWLVERQTLQRSSSAEQAISTSSASHVCPNEAPILADEVFSASMPIWPDTDWAPPNSASLPCLVRPFFPATFSIDHASSWPQASPRERHS